MGNSDSKLSFRKAVIQLTTKTQPVDVNDDAFWDQFWAENVATIQVRKRLMLETWQYALFVE